MRLIAFIEYAAVMIGVIAMISGQLFALPKGFHLGVFMTGAGIALGGGKWLEPLAFDGFIRKLPRRAWSADIGRHDLLDRLWLDLELAEARQIPACQVVHLQ